MSRSSATSRSADMLFVHARNHGAERLAEGVASSATRSTTGGRWPSVRIRYASRRGSRRSEMPPSSWRTTSATRTRSTPRRRRCSRCTTSNGSAQRRLVAQEKAVLARYLDDDASSAGTRDRQLGVLRRPSAPELPPTGRCRDRSPPAGALRSVLTTTTGRAAAGPLARVRGHPLRLDAHINDVVAHDDGELP